MRVALRINAGRFWQIPADACVQRQIKQNSDQVEQLKNGKTKVLGFLVGQVMKETSGKANPKKVNELIHTILEL